jgi:hypothetical protein
MNCTVNKLLACVTADIEALLKMHLSDDVRQQASLEILVGKPLRLALIHAKYQVKRDYQRCGFIDLDCAFDDALPMLDTIAAPQSPFEIENWRAGIFDEEFEAFLDSIRGGAAHYGRSILKKSPRRGQQVINDLIEKMEQLRKSGKSTDLNFNGGTGDE